MVMYFYLDCIINVNYYEVMANRTNNLISQRKKLRLTIRTIV